MRISGEKEYCIGITQGEAKQYCARVTEWARFNVPYHAARLTASKAPSSVTPNQSPGRQALLNSDRIIKNFLSSNVNPLTGLFTAGKKIEKQNRRSVIGRFRITQRNVVFQNHIFDLKIVN